MEWNEALDLVCSRVAEPVKQIYIGKCAEEHPNHLKWRNEMVRMATWNEKPIMPPLASKPCGSCGGKKLTPEQAAFKDQKIKEMKEAVERKKKLAKELQETRLAQARSQLTQEVDNQSPT